MGLMESTLEDLIKHTIETDEAESLKQNLTNLRRVIKWVPSKYNDYTKKEVISDIMTKTTFNDNLRPFYVRFWRYDCGSKSEGWHNRGRTFTLVCHPKCNYLICEYAVDDIKVYRLEVD